MAMVVGVRFNQNGKIYDFDAGTLQFLPGDRVMVETSRGIECGEVARANRELKEVREDIKPVLRRATPEDLERAEKNAIKARDAMRICQERIAAHNLDMKLVDAEYSFDNTKITFNFTAEGRVDFRNLVKDLASTLHARIELHQIGVRDEAKKLGGIGICGQPFCCSRFLKEFQPVSIKMAKEQGLSLNPTKISGSCGRLMCCLKYEQDVYEELNKLSPKLGSIIQTPDGPGKVVECNTLSGKIKVRLENGTESSVVEIMRDDLNRRPEEKPAESAPAPVEEAVEKPVEKPSEKSAEKPAAKQNQNRGGDKPVSKANHRPHHHRPRTKRQG